MNKTNRALMGALIGIALVYVVFLLISALINIGGGNFTFDLVPFYKGAAMPEAYWSFIGLITQDSEAATMALLVAGFALVVVGCVSKPTWDLRGSDDDPQEYLFTHRPMAFLWCLMIPWNIFIMAWRMKKVPVIPLLFFIPFMFPFALMMDLVLLLLFVIVWMVMTIRIKTAATKDQADYERDCQYAVCPKCKMNFYQPDVKCKCGLVLSYPTPNRYGVTYHTCNNGHKIPSTNADGARARLPAVCPFCKGNIFTHEAKPIVISLVGSVGSGKTTMMLSAVESIAALAKERGIVSEIISDGISASAQRGRGRVPPTRTGELDSQYFFLRSRDLPEKEVMINDISGVEFQPDKDKNLFEAYYRYNDGIIFTIDPLEVMALHHSQSPTKGSKNTPIATLESFYHMYTEINGYGPAVKSSVPFAVVLTKMDDPRVSSAVNSCADPTEFLEKYSHGMIVDISKSAFGNVRYFKVASLGDRNNAMDPFMWVLRENDSELKKRLS